MGSSHSRRLPKQSERPEIHLTHRTGGNSQHGATKTVQVQRQTGAIPRQYQPSNNANSASERELINSERGRSTGPYRPLNHNVDCTRLVKIEDCDDSHSPIVCDLVEVEFGQRPVYVALSYRWGEEVSQATKHTITLCGCTFQVGKNLWDALQFLRRCRKKNVFWIDAICINQEDVKERNRQLRMMPHIYGRAAAVFVWLGAAYSGFPFKIPSSIPTELPTPGSGTNDAPGHSPRAEQTQLQCSSAPNSTNPSGPSTNASEAEANAQSDAQQTALRREICQDEYWNRVWIVQEIGKARRIRVCFGDSMVGWLPFIRWLSLDSCISADDKQGPMKLHKQLQNKYKGSYTLASLLRTRRDAHCKDARDKIYGFIGLANDSSGFPMDYSKSLTDVWIDTMTFVQNRGLISATGSAVADFGILVKELLGGASIGNVKHLLQPTWSPSPVPATPQTPSPVVWFDAHIIGVIDHIGPAVTDLISDFSKVEDWASEIERRHRKDAAAANREHDTLMRAILDSDYSRFASLGFGHCASVWWSRGFSNERYRSPYHQARDPYQAFDSTIFHHLRKTSQLYHEKTSTAPGVFRERGPFKSPRVFQLQSPNRHKTHWKIGVTSVEVEIGDFVFWIRCLRRMVVVKYDCHKRAYRGYHSALFDEETIDMDLRVFGTATMAADLADNFAESIKSRDEILAREATTEVPVDIKTLLVLLCLEQPA